MQRHRRRSPVPCRTRSHRGGGRIAWLAAIHDQRDDASNPLAHLIIRDKDHETGKRVFDTSEKGSTDRLRQLWETVANRALEQAGTDARIDRRSLGEQGIDRQPGIHIGPNVLAMEDQGLRPVSLVQEVENGRVVNWPEIDQGRTRADRQREIDAGNLELERERERSKDKGRTAIVLRPVMVDRASGEAHRRDAVERQQMHESLDLPHQDDTPTRSAGAAVPRGGQNSGARSRAQKAGCRRRDPQTRAASAGAIERGATAATFS